MNIEKIDLNSVLIYENRDDIEKIRQFLENKYSKKIQYTIFKKNLVLFAATVEYPRRSLNIKKYITDESIFLTIIQNKHISDAILNFDIPVVDGHPFFDVHLLSETRLNLIKGFSCVKTFFGFSFDVMSVDVCSSYLSNKNIFDFYNSILSNKKTNTTITLLEFVLFFSNNREDENIQKIIGIFIEAYKYQLLKKKHRLLYYYFNKEYFLTYGNVIITPVAE